MNSSSDKIFANVRPGVGKEYECTPKIADDFIGLRINAPSIVKFTPGHKDAITGVFAKIIVCSVYRFESFFIQEVGSIKYALTIVAVDTQTHIPYKSKLTEPKWLNILSAPEPEEPKYSYADLKGHYSKGYININLLDYLDLPERSASYQIFFVLQKYKSNVMTITLKSRDE